MGDIGRNRGIQGYQSAVNLEVNELELKALFETFIQTFRLQRDQHVRNGVDQVWDDDLFENDPNMNDVPTQPYYLNQLQTIFENAMSSDTANCDYLIDLHHIKSHCMNLLLAIIRHPADLIIFMDEVLADMVDRLYTTYEVSDEMLQNRRLTLKVCEFHINFD